MGILSKEFVPGVGFLMKNLVAQGSARRRMVTSQGDAGIIRSIKHQQLYLHNPEFYETYIFELSQTASVIESQLLLD